MSDRIVTTLVTGPAIEPLTLAEVKGHFPFDTSTFEESLTPAICIAPGEHAIAANYGLEGTAVDVLGYEAVAVLNAGACGAGGSVTAKLQSSDDGTTWVNVTDGAFTVVTEANDNATFEVEYTGVDQYIRVVATVAGAACIFDATIMKNAHTSSSDTKLNNYITVARQYAEMYLGKSLITQTWKQFFQCFPRCNFIELAYPPLQSVTHVKYKDFQNEQYTLGTDDSVDTEVDTDQSPGRIVLQYNETWPTVSLWPINPVEVQFICGYGSTRTSIPECVRQAMLFDIQAMYEGQGKGPVWLKNMRTNVVNPLLNQADPVNFGF